MSTSRADTPLVLFLELTGIKQSDNMSDPWGWVQTNMIFVVLGLSVSVRNQAKPPQWKTKDFPSVGSSGCWQTRANRHDKILLAKKPRDYRKPPFLCNCFLIEFESILNRRYA